MSEDYVSGGGYSDTGYPLPAIDPGNKPFWEGTAEGRLLLQQCNYCDELLYPPRILCPKCYADLEWVEASGTGTVYTYTIMHRPSLPEIFNAWVPFVLAVIELDEGPYMLSILKECEPTEVAFDMEVEVIFEPITDEISLPMFIPQ